MWDEANGGAENKYSFEPARQAAQEKGRERLDAFMRGVYMVAGADVLVVRSTEVASQYVSDKATELRNRAVDFRDRTVERAKEIKDDLTQRGVDAAWDAAGRIDDVSGRVINKATELSKRAQIAGLKPAAWMQEKYADIYQVPASIREVVAGKHEQKAVMLHVRAIGEEENYQEQLRLLAEAHQRKLESLSGARDTALEKSGEHKQKAAERRAKAAGMTQVRDRIAAIEASL